MPGEGDSEPLIHINGRAVSPVLLEPRALQRCRLEECQSQCCSGGVWIHDRQVEDILAHQELIAPHLPPERRDPATWFDGASEPDVDYPEAGPAMGTTVIPDPTHPAGETCIFLRPDRLCALQAAGIAAGEHPWRFKPFYCALHPLGLDGGQLTLVEGSEIYQEGGHCSRPSDNGSLPVFKLYDSETRLVLGEAGYAVLEEMVKARN